MSRILSITVKIQFRILRVNDFKIQIFDVLMLHTNDSLHTPDLYIVYSDVLFGKLKFILFKIYVNIRIITELE